MQWKRRCPLQTAVQEATWGRAAEGLYAQQEVPKDTTKGQQEPCSPPVLLTSLQVRKYEMSPTPLLWPPSWELISVYPQASSAGGPSLPQVKTLGQAMEQEQGFTPFPGLKRRRKTNTDPTAQLLTVVKICPHSSQYKSCSFLLELLWLHQRAPHQTSCSLFLQPCLSEEFHNL